MKYLISFVVIGLLFYGCEKPPSYSIIPHITFLSMTPTIVRSFTNSNSDAQGLPDSANIQISFTDGDGDIGIPEDDNTDYDAFLISNQTNNSNPNIDSLRIPYVTPNGNIKSISGTISLEVLDITGRPDHPIWDTISYTIVIRDRAGHVSNTQVTPPLYVKDN
jgi:hypothetical protein